MRKIYIRRIFAIIFCLISLYALYGVVAAFVGTFKEIERLSNDPSASGIEFLLLEPLFIVLFSVLGLVCSGVSVKLCAFKTAKITSLVLFFLFSVILIIAFTMWYFRVVL